MSMRAQYFLLCAFCALTVVSFPVFGTVSAMQVERLHVEAKKGLPIVLCMHVPFFTEAIWLAHEVFWRNGEKYSGECVCGRPGRVWVEVGVINNADKE